MTQDQIIAHLIDVHGETGLAHSASDWRAIFATGEGPLHVLNLLKFRTEVQGTEGIISGREAYRRYARANAGAFQRAGAESLFFGRVHVLTGTPGLPDWDAAVLSRYPSAQALAQMWLDRDHVEASANRGRALERSQSIFSGVQRRGNSET